LNHIRASGEQTAISGYLINSYRFQNSDVTAKFWKLQLSIVAQLRLIRSLSVLVAIVIQDHDGRCVDMFTGGLKAAHWKSYWFVHLGTFQQAGTLVVLWQT